LQNANRQRNPMRESWSFILLPFDFMLHHRQRLSASAGGLQDLSEADCRSLCPLAPFLSSRRSCLRFESKAGRAVILPFAPKRNTRAHAKITVPFSDIFRKILYCRSRKYL
jgi:hypothetical protein